MTMRISWGGALAAVAAMGLATACSLLLSPDDLSAGGNERAAPGDATVPSADAGDGGCIDLPHAVSRCPGFCDRFAPDATYCYDFDDGGLEGPLPPLQWGRGGGGVLEPRTEKWATPPAALLSYVPDSSDNSAYAHLGIRFDAEHAAHVRLSMDVFLEGGVGAAPVLALTFAPDTPVSHDITVVVNRGERTTELHETVHDPNIDAGYYERPLLLFSKNIPFGEWAHLELDVDFSSTRHMLLVLLNGRQVANFELSAGWESTKVALELGMFYASSYFSFYYDNVLLTVQPPP